MEKRKKVIQDFRDLYNNLSVYSKSILWAGILTTLLCGLAALTYIIMLYCIQNLDHTSWTLVSAMITQTIATVLVTVLATCIIEFTRRGRE